MALFKSGNPALGEKAFSQTYPVYGDEAMTVKGTLNKFGILFLLTMATAGLAWKMASDGVNIRTYMWVSLFATIGIGFVTTFKKNLSPYLAPIYALFEGFFVGSISAFYNYAFAKIAPNIIMQAVGLTFGVVIAMYLLYKFNIIKATPLFKKIIITATAGIAIFYLINLGLHFAGINLPFLHEGSSIGIIFSLVVVGLASMNLIVDFDMIENGSKMGAPKYMEWYGGFALLVTIVWLYLEILRLLSKLAKRD
jgi:uncharacterized YccA/Bax inhibitor family protein